MKTKEIYVWVDRSEEALDAIGSNLNDFRSDIKYYKSACSSRAFKAKLIIEIPEKKIEITEREFDEAFEKHAYMYNQDYDNAEINKSELKKELGF